MTLNNNELKYFGILFGSIFSVLFGLIFPWIFSKDTAYWPWLIGALFILLSLIYPNGLSPFYKIWMKFGHVMGWINTRIILAMMFYLMFVPTGFCIRLFGKDLLNIKFKNVESYRKDSISQDKEHLRRPY
jgi:hypothetical protein|tara:strand:- start:141 stop:530 length:390 start_codon:yes stop_codon:yes gene_type:complete